MQNALKANEWRRISVIETFEIERQNGGLNNSAVLQNWFIPEFRSPSLQFVEISNVWKRYSRMMHNALKSND